MTPLAVKLPRAQNKQVLHRINAGARRQVRGRLNAKFPVMKNRNPNISFRMAVLTLCFLSLAFSSCTRAIRTSTAVLRQEDEAKKLVFRIKTIDNKSYEFESYRIAGDTLIVTVPHKYLNSEIVEKIPLDRVKKIERIEINKTNTTILLSVIAVFLAAFGYFVHSMAQIGGG